MTILAPPELPVFRETIHPRAAFLIYEIDAHLLATVHPLSATRQGHAVIGVGRPLDSVVARYKMMTESGR